MNVSVIICTYSSAMFTAVTEAVESVLEQTYEYVDVIVVVDGNHELYKRIESKYGENKNVRIHLNDRNVGLSESRNNALEYVNADIIAFMDDDAVADPCWIKEIVSVYQQREAIAVGGRMVADWVAGKPTYLPEEFYWLIGVTHKGFAAPNEEVRNTFGSNISFRREVFEEIGGFDPEFGRRGSLNIQSEETIFCVQMYEHYGQRVVYNPDAVVAHKIFDYRTNPVWLIKRAFWQGYSKRVMEQIVNDECGNEKVFLKQLLNTFVPNRCTGLIRSPSVPQAMQLFSIIVLTFVVGLGYGYRVSTELLP